MAKPAISMRVKTYFDAPGMMKSVDEGKRPVLKKAAVKIRNTARRSMKRAATPPPTLADVLPGALKPFARMGIRAIFQQAAALGIPASIVSAAVRRSGRGRRGKRRGTPSKPGTPPNVQSGIGKANVIAEMDKKTGDVQIGPSGPGWYLRLHEFGLGKFPKRPFMSPALEKHRRRLPQEFKKMQISKTKAGRRMNRIKNARGPKVKTTGSV